MPNAKSDGMRTSVRSLLNLRFNLYSSVSLPLLVPVRLPGVVGRLPPRLGGRLLKLCTVVGVDGLVDGLDDGVVGREEPVEPGVRGRVIINNIGVDREHPSGAWCLKVKPSNAMRIAAYGACRPTIASGVVPLRGGVVVLRAQSPRCLANS